MKAKVDSSGNYIVYPYNSNNLQEDYSVDYPNIICDLDVKTIEEWYLETSESKSKGYKIVDVTPI